MDEKLRIVVEADGTHTVSRALQDIGIEGYKAAVRIESSFASAMSNLRYQTKVALNSSRLAEKSRVDAARQASQEIAKARQSEARAAAAAARAEINSAREAARQVTRLEVEKARAKRRAEQASRTQQRDAKNDATFGLGHFGNVLGLLGLKGAISSFIEYSDAAVNVSNRLGMVTTSQEQLLGLTERLRQKSLETRTEFDLTTRTYARLAQSTRQLGLSQGANLAMTETLTEAIAVSGATGEEAHATLIQLSQALASNRLSADEFRSVAEQLPIILDLLADSTGKARVELKGMGEDGKLTARVVSLAILEGHDKIADMFAKTTPTIEQAWQNIKTQTQFAVQEFNKATGASQKVTDALKYIAENMDTVTKAAKALGTMIGVYLVTQIGLAAKGLVTLAATNPWIAAATALAGLIVLVIQYKDEIGQIAEKHRTLSEIIAQQDLMKIQTGKEVGIPEALAAMDERDHLGKVDTMNSQHAVDTENERLDRMFAIADLRKMKDAETKKKKRGRHVPTFGEAVKGLEDDMMVSYLKKSQEDAAKEVIKVQAQVQRQLTAEEAKYVNQLVKSKNMQDMLKKAQEESAQVAQKRYDEETKSIIELRKEREKSAVEAMKIRKDQLVLENKIFGGPKALSKINDVDELFAAREATVNMVKGGRLDKKRGMTALDTLEMNDPNTTPIRKQFLEETNGIGKMADSINGVFGPDGMLNKGLSDATANAIVFHQNFSQAINSLGKQIQAEIISTLVGGLIRMAILTAMGGGDRIGTALSAAKSLQAIGTGKASGGYVEGGRTQIAGYHHGGEFVVNAQATQQNRGVLEAINKGGKAGRAGGGGGVNITFMDYAGVNLEAQPMGENEVRLIARKEIGDQSGRVIAGNIRDPNSDVGKAMRGNTNVRYAR